MAACTRRGIPVGNTPGVLTETTADLAWALLMAAARRLPEGDDYVRAGHWKTWGPLLLLGPDVHGATLGIVGFGRIGQADRAAGPRLRDDASSYHDADARRRPRMQAALGVTAVSQDELLARERLRLAPRQPDAETRATSSTPAALARMKPTAVLVNTSRGPVVDQVALADALRDGASSRRPPSTSPTPSRCPRTTRSLALDNCLIVPHIASASRAPRAARWPQMAAANLLAGVRGEPLPTPVNPEVYDRSRAG